MMKLVDEARRIDLSRHIGAAYRPPHGDIALLLPAGGGEVGDMVPIRLDEARALRDLLTAPRSPVASRSPRSAVS